MSLAVTGEAAAPGKSLLRWRMKLNPPEPQRDWVLGPDHRGSPRGEVRRGGEGESCPCAPLRPWQEFQLQGLAVSLFGELLPPENSFGSKGMLDIGAPAMGTWERSQGQRPL